MKCCVLGSGTWGTALAQVLADNGNDVIVYGVDKNEVNDISQNHQNKKYFGDDLFLPTSLKASSNLEEVLSGAEVIVLAVPTNAVRIVLNNVKPLLKNKPYLVSVAKGFDPQTLMRMSDVVRDVIPSDLRHEIVSLIGPGHAEEVIKRMLTCITSTCVNEEDGKFIQELFSNNYLRVYYQSDEIGAEYGAAIKNAIAIASGITQGCGMGDNAKAALVTRGLVEMIRFGKMFGGKEDTFMGLTGIGDLMVTCNSLHSRNYQAGYAIGKDNYAENFLKTNTKTVEGIRTTEIIYKIAQDNNIDMPIITATYNVLFKGHKADEELKTLMVRKLKNE